MSLRKPMPGSLPSSAPAARRAAAPGGLPGAPAAPASSPNPASTPPFRPAPRVPYELQLARDATGRIAARTEILDGTPARWDYEYDAHGRIVRVRRNDGGQKPGDVLEEYRYDAQGRRVFEHNRLRDAGGRTYRYARGDELRSCASADFIYDDGGFLTEKRHAGFTTRYAWGPGGALVRVDLPDGRVLSYEYEGGRRTAKRVNGEPIELFRWQGPRLAAWQDLRDGTLVRFEYADERARLPVALHDGTDRFWLAFDQVGSLRAVANDQGKVVKRITYDTFGNVIYESAPQVVIPLGFAGGLRDVDTGLTRFGVRDYDPLFGRFIARDPLGAAAGDPDVYGYCLDDPVNMVDPTGYSGIALPGPIPMPLPPVFIPGTRENHAFTKGTIGGLNDLSDRFTGWLDGKEEFPAQDTPAGPLNKRKGGNKQKNRPRNPNKHPQQTPEEQEEGSVRKRQRNMKPKGGEEHSRTAKGQRKNRGQRGAPGAAPAPSQQNDDDHEK